MIAAFGVNNVLAQAMLEEVVVTAQKREQNLQDVPVAVSVFTGAMIEKAGAKDMFDLATNAPSLNVDQAQTSTTTTFGIRGIFTSSQNFGLEPSVGLYVDGVYLGRQVGQNWSLANIERVEVLRGPQGTLYARNSIGGAINIITCKPGDKDGGRVGEKRVVRHDAGRVLAARRVAMTWCGDPQRELPPAGSFLRWRYGQKNRPAG